MHEKANKSYPFYDYLSFLWKKKRWLLGITVAMVVIAIIISLLVKPTYEGTVVFNVADAIDDKVTIPDIILSNYQNLLPEEIRGSFQVVVPKYKQVQISLSGKNSEQVTKGLESVTKAYYADLQKAYQQRKSLAEQYIATLQQRVDALEQAAKLMHPSSGNIESYTNLQSELATRQEQLQVSQVDLSRTQAPIIVPPNSLDNLVITKQSSPWKGNLAIGLLSGILLAIIITVLWKYILDAQIAQKQQQ
jgi:uncharacterized protein involved in exopolysaccharide biosynthesis